MSLGKRCSYKMSPYNRPMPGNVIVLNFNRFKFFHFYRIFALTCINIKITSYNIIILLNGFII